MLVLGWQTHSLDGRASRDAGLHCGSSHPRPLCCRARETCDLGLENPHNEPRVRRQGAPAPSARPSRRHARQDQHTHKEAALAKKPPLRTEGRRAAWSPARTSALLLRSSDRGAFHGQRLLVLQSACAYGGRQKPEQQEPPPPAAVLREARHPGNGRRVLPVGEGHGGHRPCGDRKTATRGWVWTRRWASAGRMTKAADHRVFRAPHGPVLSVNDPH